MLSLPLLHVFYWLLFPLSRALGPYLSPGPGKSPRSRRSRLAPDQGVLGLRLHALGFGLLYAGFGGGTRPPQGAWIAALIPFLLAGALVPASLLSLPSWRLKARVDRGHILSRSGPYAVLLHPIYLSLDLLALGTLILLPRLLVLAGFILIHAGAEIRGREEEKVLEAAFGKAYRDYRRGKARFLPGLY